MQKVALTWEQARALCQAGRVVTSEAGDTLSLEGGARSWNFRKVWGPYTLEGSQELTLDEAGIYLDAGGEVLDVDGDRWRFREDEFQEHSSDEWSDSSCGVFGACGPYTLAPAEHQGYLEVEEPETPMQETPWGSPEVAHADQVRAAALVDQPMPPAEAKKELDFFLEVDEPTDSLWLALSWGLFQDADDDLVRVVETGTGPQIQVKKPGQGWKGAFKGCIYVRPFRRVGT